MSFADLLILLLTTSAQLIGIVSFAKVADEKVEAKRESLHTQIHMVVILTYIRIEQGNRLLCI